MIEVHHQRQDAHHGRVYELTTRPGSLIFCLEGPSLSISIEQSMGPRFLMSLGSSSHCVKLALCSKDIQICQRRRSAKYVRPITEGCTLAHDKGRKEVRDLTLRF